MPDYFRCDGLVEWVNECAQARFHDTTISALDGFYPVNLPTAVSPDQIASVYGTEEMLPDLDFLSIDAGMDLMRQEMTYLLSGRSLIQVAAQLTSF